MSIKKKPLTITNGEKGSGVVMVVEPTRVILSIPEGFDEERLDEVKFVADKACEIKVSLVYTGTFEFKKTLVRCQMWTPREVARMTLTLKNKKNYEATW